jgi:hypothetical protein
MGGTATTDLSSLPREHELRNAPLLDIGAQLRWSGSPPGKGWKSVRKSWKVASLTYNDLGPAWTKDTQWRAKVSPSHT